QGDRTASRAIGRMRQEEGLSFIDGGLPIRPVHGRTEVSDVVHDAGFPVEKLVPITLEVVTGHGVKLSDPVGSRSSGVPFNNARRGGSGPRPVGRGRDGARS